MASALEAVADFRANRVYRDTGLADAKIEFARMAHRFESVTSLMHARLALLSGSVITHDFSDDDGGLHTFSDVDLHVGGLDGCCDVLGSLLRFRWRVLCRFRRFEVAYLCLEAHAFQPESSLDAKFDPDYILTWEWEPDSFAEFEFDARFANTSSSLEALATMGARRPFGHSEVIASIFQVCQLP